MANKHSVEILLSARKGFGTDEVFKSFHDRLREIATNGLKGFGDMKLTLGGTAQAAGVAAAGINAAAIAGEVLAGDIQKAAERVKQLPFGVGQVATALEGVLGKWTGISDEIKKSNDYLKMQEAWTSAVAKRAKLVADSHQQAIANLRAYGRELRDLGMSGTPAKLAASGDKASDRLNATDTTLAANKAALNEQLKAQLRAAEEYRKTEIRKRVDAVPNYGASFGPRDLFGTQSQNSAVNEIGREADRRAEAARREHAAALKKIEADAAAERTAILKVSAKSQVAIFGEAFDAMRERARTAADEFRQAWSKAQATLSDATNELKAKQLEAAGDSLGAAVERISTEYRSRIEEAVRTGQSKLAETFRQMRTLDIAAARETSVKERANALANLTKAREADALGVKRLERYDPRGNAALVSSVLSRSPGSGSEQTFRQQLDTTRKLLDESRQQGQALRDIRRAVEKSGVAVGV